MNSNCVQNVCVVLVDALYKPVAIKNRLLSGGTGYELQQAKSVNKILFLRQPKLRKTRAAYKIFCTRKTSKRHTKIFSR
jgi:hypothetical protein